MASKNRYLHFYPRSPCGERLLANLQIRGALDISIHALLAESDDDLQVPVSISKISIHALLAESDLAARDGLADLVFLSTLSLRRATILPLFFAPPIPISIHALLAESDPHNGGPWQGGYTISIHALLAESDPSLSLIHI